MEVRTDALVFIKSSPLSEVIKKDGGMGDIPIFLFCSVFLTAQGGDDN
jgi:hypothetical protein